MCVVTHSDGGIYTYVTDGMVWESPTRLLSVPLSLHGLRVAHNMEGHA